MPCDSIITNTVNLENVKNADLLEKALKALDPRAQRTADGRFVFRHDGTAITIRDGKATSTLSTQRLGAALDQVKQSYSREAVKYAAKRFNISVEWDKQDINQFTLVNR